MVTYFNDLATDSFGSQAREQLGYNATEHIMAPFFMQEGVEKYTNNSPTLRLLMRSNTGGTKFVQGVKNPRVKYKVNTKPDESDYVLETPTYTINAGRDVPICVVFKGENGFRMRQGYTVGAWSASYNKVVYAYVTSIEDAGSGAAYKAYLKYQTQDNVLSLPADILAADTCWMELFRGVAFDESDAGRGRLWNISEGFATVGFTRADIKITDGANNAAKTDFALPVWNSEAGKFEYHKEPMAAFEAHNLSQYMTHFNNFLFGSQESNPEGKHTMFDPTTGEPIWYPQGFDQSISRSAHQFSYTPSGGLLDAMANAASAVLASGNEIFFGSKTFLWLTGSGGKYEFGKAVSKKAILETSFIEGLGTKYVMDHGSVTRPEVNGLASLYKDTVNGLVIGTQFSGFIDFNGHLHLIVHDPYYDQSAFAKLSPLVKSTGFRQFSYGFRLLDMSAYPNINGEMVPNIRFLYVEGLDWLEHTVLGATMRVPTGWPEWQAMGKARATTRAVGFKSWAMSGALHIADPRLCATINYTV